MIQASEIPLDENALIIESVVKRIQAHEQKIDEIAAKYSHRRSCKRYYPRDQFIEDIQSEATAINNLSIVLDRLTAPKASNENPLD